MQLVCICCRLCYNRQVTLQKSININHYCVFKSYKYGLLLSPQTKFGDLLFLHCFLLLRHPDCCRVTYCYSKFLFHYYYYSYYSTHFCPLDFSEMPWSNFMKPCRNIICHVKLCCSGLIFSKWPPLPWKRPKC